MLMQTSLIGDMARSLKDSVTPALADGLHSLKRGAHIGVTFSDREVRSVHTEVVFRIRKQKIGT